MGSRGDSFDPFWRDRSHDNTVKLPNVTSSEKPFSDAFQWPEDTVWNVDEADPWTPSPPHMVDTSMESDTDRVNLSFSSELGSLFPKLGIQGSPDRSKKASVAIVMQERLSILFDGMTPEPSCRVVGKILVQKPAIHTTPDSFSLTIRDPKGHVEKWDVEIGTCREDEDASARNMFLEGKDRMFLVDTNAIHQQASILEYFCTSKLKPIPMLIKTKLETIEKGRYRLGIRVRANPKNDYILQNLVVLVVVPPDVNVDDPPEGGIWDELKRTLSWTCGSLQSGHGVYIQPTFTTNTINDSRRFPILLHSQGDHLFSRLDIRGNTIDERPLDLEVQHETTILYRKI